MPNIHAILKRNYPQGMAGASGNGNPVRPHGSAAAQVLRRNQFNVRMTYMGVPSPSFSARLARYLLTTGTPPALQFDGWEDHPFNLSLAEGDLSEVFTGNWEGLQYGAEASPYVFATTQRRPNGVYYADFHTESLGWVVDERGDNAEIEAYYGATFYPDSFILFTPWLENPVRANYPEVIRSVTATLSPGVWIGLLGGFVSASVSFGSSTGFYPEGFKCYGHSAPEQAIDECGGGSNMSAVWVFAARQHRIHSRLELSFSELAVVDIKNRKEVPGGGAIKMSSARPIFSGITPVFSAN